MGKKKTVPSDKPNPSVLTETEGAHVHTCTHSVAHNTSIWILGISVSHCGCGSLCAALHGVIGCTFSCPAGSIKWPEGIQTTQAHIQTAQISRLPDGPAFPVNLQTQGERTVIHTNTHLLLQALKGLWASGKRQTLFSACYSIGPPLVSVCLSILWASAAKHDV